MISWENRKGGLFWLTIISSLLALNRLDTLLFVIPALGLSFFRELKDWRRNTGLLLLGLLPFFMWELFSMIYYGFPFPNTAYAKLNTGIGERLLLFQGLDYFVNSMGLDPLTLFVVALAGVSVVMERDQNIVVVYSGVLLYLLYTVRKR